MRWRPFPCSFAIWIYATKMINSVGVLLIVNSSQLAGDVNGRINEVQVRRPAA
jgi:hypothetical protein